MRFGKGFYKEFEDGLEREWVITNGIGGYGGSTIINARARKHHAYLVASLHAPVLRYAVLDKTDEQVKIEDKIYSFAANMRVGGWNDEGQNYLQSFEYQEVPEFTYQAEGFFVKKTIAMEWEKNTVAISYDIMNGSKGAEFSIKPLLTFRDHNLRLKDYEFDFEESFEDEHTFKFVPNTYKKDRVNVRVYCSEGTFAESEEKFDLDAVLLTEIKTGGESVINSYTPYDIKISVKPFEHKKVSFVCSVEDEFCRDAFATVETAKTRIRALKEKAGFEDDFASTLAAAADQFIVQRESTGKKTILAGYPWFTDWGRDTMIAFTGLTLVTKRFEDARGILKSFAMYVKNGLVPNMFPDEDLEPLYNTVDGSMWYFYAVKKYLEYTGADSDYTFIKNEIYEKLEEIIHFYEHGTDFSIYMDRDGLVSAGGGFDQVTWMDVRVGEWVVTPRHGKPVEVNALWYNALKLMEELSARFGKVSEYGKTTQEYAAMAEHTKESFQKKFYNEKQECLYDVVSDEGNDDKIRCNQIYAVSLPYSVLEPEMEKKVVHKVINELYATYGLRTLNADNPEYQPYYRGKLHDRDAAYHQGTAWAFPLGALVTAYVKVTKNDENQDFVRAYAKNLIRPLQDHLMDGCIGQIAEIFDGNEPNISRGTYAQAWSVGEILRAYSEDILG